MPFDPALRPRRHFTPRARWLNDPNGLVYADGEYHLFFQHDADGLVPQRMSWGHAVSGDLLAWDELPVALAPTDERHVFSGSAIVDDRNTSGLGSAETPAMVIAYTAHHPVTGVETQCLASSIDRGRTWVEYPGNPVLDIGSTAFRDPKLIRASDGWLMALALADERQVALYASADLRAWREVSRIGPLGALEGVWECPDLIEVPIEGGTDAATVLLVSVQSGAPAGGSGMQYVVGRFDGHRFVPTTDARWFDHGADCYAAVSFADAPGAEPVVIGWMNNWAYALDVPAGEYRGSMTVPRALRLRPTPDGLVLVQAPITADPAARAIWEHRTVDGESPVPDRLVSGRIRLELSLGAAERAGIDVRVGRDERTRIALTPGALTLDRTSSSSERMPPGFAAAHSAAVPTDRPVTLDIVVDVASIEVFAADGAVVLTDQIFPSPDSDGIAVFAEGGAAEVRDLRIATDDGATHPSR